MVSLFCLRHFLDVAKVAADACGRAIEARINRPPDVTRIGGPINEEVVGGVIVKTAEGIIFSCSLYLNY